MTAASHDQNFKNLFQDFPEEALEWVLPEVLREFGPIRRIEFIRQEPKKRRLSDSHLSLDMPILFRFDRREVLLWLVEFHEDKSKFSIFRVLRYTVDMSEAHPEALVIPAALFTDRTRWKKDVPKTLDHRFGNRSFLHFEYVFVRLFEARARDFFDSGNPLVRILLPKMDFDDEERGTVFRKALTGLFELASAPLFEKYAEFIDVYSGIPDEEREAIYRELDDNEETTMIAQYFKDKGIEQGETRLLCRQISTKYGLSPKTVSAYLENLGSETLLELGDRILEWDSFDPVKNWIEARQKKAADTEIP